jgi:hypothetical protein
MRISIYHPTGFSYIKDVDEGKEKEKEIKEGG